MTTMTVKGQVTIPKGVRKDTGIKPGDKLDVRSTAAGGVYIEKAGKSSEYRKALLALAEKRLIRDGMTTDEFMEITRGEIAAAPRRGK